MRPFGRGTILDFPSTHPLQCSSGRLPANLSNFTNSAPSICSLARLIAAQLKCPNNLCKCCFIFFTSLGTLGSVNFTAGSFILIALFRFLPISIIVCLKYASSDVRSSLLASSSSPESADESQRTGSGLFNSFVLSVWYLQRSGSVLSISSCISLSRSTGSSCTATLSLASSITCSVESTVCADFCAATAFLSSFKSPTPLPLLFDTWLLV